MTLLAVHTMLLQKSCIDHIVQKQTCGVLVLSLIYYFVVADHSGHELNQGFSAQCWELILILMIHHGNQYLLKLKILSKDFLTRTTGKEWLLPRHSVSALTYIFFFHFLVSAYQLYSTFIHTSDSSLLMCCLHVAAHPWLRDERRQIPLDMLVFKLVKAYLRSTPLKRAALKVNILVPLAFNYTCFVDGLVENSNVFTWHTFELHYLYFYITKLAGLV